MSEASRQVLNESLMSWPGGVPLPGVSGYPFPHGNTNNSDRVYNDQQQKSSPSMHKLNTEQAISELGSSMDSIPDQSKPKITPLKYSRLNSDGTMTFKPTPEKTHECLECNRCFSRKSFLKTHMVTHSGEKNFQCPVCEIRFTLNASMKRHLKTTHAEEKLYKCTECDKVYAQQGSWSLHMRQQHGDNPYKCSLCGKGVADEIKLERHMKLHEEKYRCGSCSEVFTTRRELKNHVLVHSDKERFVCVECGKVFLKGGNLALHMKSHHSGDGQTTHMCDICGCCFSVYRHLHLHLKKEHKQETEKKAKCIDICICTSRKSTSKRRRRKQRSIPTDKEQTGKDDEEDDEEHELFVCAECGRCFIQEEHLRFHVEELNHNVVITEDKEDDADY